MELSVVVCTWNRADQLARMLERLGNVPVDSDVRWEVVVVNNNCTDHTADIVAANADRLPIRMVLEPEQGISHARNRGISESCGELLLWTDDDIIVGDEWLNAYARASRQLTDYDFFGGAVRPIFEGDPPAWLSRHWPKVASAFAVRDFGDEAIELTRNRLPFGANFAIRRRALDEHRFDGELGRKADSLAGGEETAMMNAILSSGGRGLWLPEAAVGHVIGRDRQSWGYLRRFFVSIGRDARNRAANRVRGRDTQAVASAASSSGLTLWALRLALIHELAFWTSRLLRRSGSSIEHLREAGFHWGRSGVA